ncbi:DUF1279 domain-containing protein [Cephalotus follicularis]|uniref:DUF1279 domain-containing protein n=1 Tax=Cephalotus follicularis TaxID=3775 RepID=A0A1Q3CYS2_CEPFO|nr:DUF1279 domain-containing protein [Cephalotus follicularis]
MTTTVLVPPLFSGSFLICNYKICIQTSRSKFKSFRIGATKEETNEIKSPSSSSSAEDVTKKYGLELGLWKILSSKDEGLEEGEKKKSKGDQAKELLTKYGGIDVQSLLQKVGISTNEAGEKVGTFALAYAAHKAASPIRFPPTVALTPIVASWIGKKVEKEK